MIIFVQSTGAISLCAEISCRHPRSPPWFRILTAIGKEANLSKEEDGFNRNTKMWKFLSAHGLETKEA